jgi:hypothetical protein
MHPRDLPRSCGDARTRVSREIYIAPIRARVSGRNDPGRCDQSSVVAVHVNGNTTVIVIPTVDGSCARMVKLIVKGGPFTPTVAFPLRCTATITVAPTITWSPSTLT